MAQANDQATSGRSTPAGAEPAPPQKGPDSHDKSSAGEEDPGAAVEEMRDPHPDARPAPGEGTPDR
jgi:hypothetical protein